MEHPSSNRGRLLRLGAFLLVATTSIAWCAPSLHWVTDGGDPSKARVEIRGLAEEPENPRALLTVRVANAAADSPAMAGSYRYDNAVLIYRPRFPLTPGLRYQAKWKKGGKESVTRDFTVPTPVPGKPTVVSKVTPTTDRLPLNLLKFYLHFSAPMTRGRTDQFVRLLDEHGEKVEDPFLELPEELWNKEMTRLTLLLDPGRIKRGLLPNQTVGAVLEAGKRYTLEIDARWKDAARQPLVKTFRKSFVATGADYDQPATKRWRPTIPVAGTREPYALRFGESLDAALATRLLTISGPGGKRIEGQITLSDREQQWAFVPKNPWTAKKHHLHIDHRLEDLAGNSIARKFEENLDRLPDKVGEGPQRSRLPFVPVQKK